MQSFPNVRPAHHYGVYGRFIHNGQLLTVRKDYGPYNGLLDLPGGQPDGVENPDETLARLMEAETGSHVEGIGPATEIDFVVTSSSTGEATHFHHTAVVADVDVADIDDSRVEWFPVDGDRSEVSELVKRALDLPML